MSHGNTYSFYECHVTEPHPNSIFYFHTISNKNLGSVQTHEVEVKYHRLLLLLKLERIYYYYYVSCWRLIQNRSKSMC
jgi:hypothetical protein